MAWGGPERILFCPKDLSSDIVVADFGMYVVLTCLLETPHIVTGLSSAKHLESAGEPLTSLAGSLAYFAPEVLTQKGHGKPVDLWSIGYCHLHERYWKNVTDEGTLRAISSHLRPCENPLL